MLGEAVDRKAINRAEKASAQAERARGEIVAGLMATIAGRQYVYERLVAAHVFSTSFTTNALQMAFAEGERNQGLQLLNDVMLYASDYYVLMMREANARSAAAERSRRPDGNGRTEARPTDPDDNRAAIADYDYDPGDDVSGADYQDTGR